MENLYEKVGRHLNYMQKAEKKEVKVSLQDRVKKVPGFRNTGMAHVQSAIRKAVASGKEEVLREKERKIVKGQTQAKHLYEYSKPVETPSLLGPGCYEVTSTLEKKSFNKSPPPTNI